MVRSARRCAIAVDHGGGRPGAGRSRWRAGQSFRPRPDGPADGRGLRRAGPGVDDPPRVPEPARRPSAAGRRGPVAQGGAGPPCRGATGADLLRRAARVLPHARRRLPARLDHVDRTNRRGPGDGRRGNRRGGDDPQSRAVSRVSRPVGGPTRTVRRRGPADHRAGEADLPLHGGAPQWRDRPARDADGARLPPGGRGRTALRSDSRQRHRHRDAGGRAGRPRPVRRLAFTAT